MFNRLCLLILSFIVFSVSANSDFKSWLRQQQTEFDTYVDEQDKEFGQFLKARWVEAEVKPQQHRDSQPKPKVIPKAAPKLVSQTDSKPDKKPLIKPKVLPKDADQLKPRINPRPVIQPEPHLVKEPQLIKEPIIKPKMTSKPELKPRLTPSPEVQPEPQLSPWYVPDVDSEQAITTKPKSLQQPKRGHLDFSVTNRSSVAVNFLGQTLLLPKAEFKPLALRKIDNKSLANDWMILAKTSFKQQVSALQKAGDALQLDDWGRALLTHEYLTAQVRLNYNSLQVYTWFYLVKQGFDSRVAYNNQQVFLMLNVEQKLYGQNYSSVGGQRYYFVDLGSKRPVTVGRVFTYDKQHSSASQAVDIDLSTAPLQAKANKTRILKTQIGQQTIQVSAPYNMAYVEYLDHYPQLNMKYYFEAELPSDTKLQLLSQLKPYIKDLSEQEALNFILRFVQTSLQYQTDDQQFKRENYLFAGETLHYPYADCEDRAVLFAYLVKELLGNKVIGLQYDGHIATAVAVDSQVTGDSYQIDGKTFVVADPTFINASIGQTMTGYDSQSPKIIRF